MIDLYELEIAEWENEGEPIEYIKEDGSLLTLAESTDIVKEVFLKDLITMKEEGDGESVFIFIKTLNDDYSAFTIVMSLVQMVLPSLDLTVFRTLDEVMECVYVYSEPNHLAKLENLLAKIKKEVKNL